MGRPVKSDINGTIVFGPYTTTSAGIKCQAYFGDSLNAACYITKQVGSRRYKVTADGTTLAVCSLVSTTPDANGEMLVYGYTDAGADTAVALAKINKRTAIDFDGNRYKWELVNDSSEDYIQLTAI